MKKLLKVRYSGPGHLEFIFEGDLRITLAEKAHWPMLVGQPLEQVEKWVKEKYLNDIDFATFGAVFNHA